MKPLNNCTRHLCSRKLRESERLAMDYTFEMADNVPEIGVELVNHTIQKNK